MATSTDVAIAFAFGVVAFGAYGAYTEGRLPILLVALLFSSLFAVVVVNGRDNSKALKALAAAGLLGLSFALHLLYLPRDLQPAEADLTRQVDRGAPCSYHIRPLGSRRVVHASFVQQ